MRNFVIWCVVLLTMAGTAFSKAPEPAEPGKAPQKSGAGGMTEGTPKEPVVALAQGSARTWTDSSGTYTTNAEFVAYDSGSGQVTLRRVDGEVITMDLSQLSEYDQGYVKRRPKELAVDLGGGVKMEMVLVPAGEFTMGDDRRARGQVRIADRGSVGIRLPGREHERVLFWRQ
jgi:hypothetical protein